MPQNQTVQKRYPTIGCCGIECGLCPRYYTVGTSRCPGCAGPDFVNKHPSCAIGNCCVKKKGLEVCAQCSEFPCPRLASWDATDSFVTHTRSLKNLEFIKQNGLVQFLEQQTRRIKWLEHALHDYDDGRSKGFYCLSAALLPIGDLESTIRQVTDKMVGKDIKVKADALREELNRRAVMNSVVLKLRGQK
jgi:hypothetical protein